MIVDALILVFLANRYKYVDYTSSGERWPKSSRMRCLRSTDGPASPVWTTRSHSTYLIIYHCSIQYTGKTLDVISTQKTQDMALILCVLRPNSVSIDLCCFCFNPWSKWQKEYVSVSICNSVSFQNETGFEAHLLIGLSLRKKNSEQTLKVSVTVEGLKNEPSILTFKRRLVKNETEL